MSYTYNGIIYHNRSSVPSYDQAASSCKNDEASPLSLDWKEQARIDIMSIMHLYMPLRKDNETVLASIKKMLLGVTLTGREYPYSVVCNTVLNQSELNTRPPAVVNLFHAIGYLANGIESSINRARDVEGYVDAAVEASQAPDAKVKCLHCETVFKHAEFEGVRIISHGNVLSKKANGRRRLCSGCLEETFRFSHIMQQYLEDNGDLEFPYFLDGDCATHSFCTSNYELIEDENGDDGWEPRGAAPRQHLLNYSANPFDYNEWDKRNAQNALVFGVELEMEPRGCRGTDLIKLLGGADQRGKNFILKSDGSLTDGVEMVTMPFTLEQHKEEKAIKWKALLSSVARMAKSGVDTDHCGMHIHVNKAALSALTIGKMLVFLNSEDLAPLITTIAQRGSGHYCERDTKKITDGVKTSANRYDIMNVSGSHPTCEIRMFRGNVRVERVYKNIEFCHALVQYCRQTGMQDLQDWGNFTRWLVSKRGQYPFLVQFLIDKRSMGFTQLVQEANEHYTPAMIEEA